MAKRQSKAQPSKAQPSLFGGAKPKKPAARRGNLVAVKAYTRAYPGEGKKRK